MIRCFISSDNGQNWVDAITRDSVLHTPQSEALNTHTPESEESEVMCTPLSGVSSDHLYVRETRGKNS
jgi:hypothetical protein